MSSYEETKQEIIETTSEEVFDLLEKMGFISDAPLAKHAKYTAFIQTSKDRRSQLDFYFEGCNKADDVMRVMYEKFTAIGRNQKINEFNQLLQRSGEYATIRHIKKKDEFNE